jgi:hypothetical protein
MFPRMLRKHGGFQPRVGFRRQKKSDEQQNNRTQSGLPAYLKIKISINTYMYCVALKTVTSAVSHVPARLEGAHVFCQGDKKKHE